MRIGYIPPPRTEGGERRRRVTAGEAAFAAEHDLRDLEIDRWSWGDDEMARAGAELATLAEHDLRMSTVGLWGQEYLNPDVDTETHLGNALSYAVEAGAGTFVTGASYPEGTPRGAAWDEAVAFYGELIDRAADRGLTTAFYVGHGNNLLVDSPDVRRFLDALPDATLKVDPANLLAAGRDPVPFVHEFADRIGHFHVKDRLVVDGEGIDQCPAGLGDVPWGKMMDLLYLGDYDGVLSIEPHGEYWGHGADDETRRQGIRMAAEHVARRLKPADRPET